MAKNNGLRDLQRRLGKIPAAIKRVAEATLDQGAEEIVQIQKRLAPHEDGTLQDSIRWKRDGELRRLITAGGPTTTKKVRNSEKGNAPEYDYALAVEFGTQKMAPQPFFWPGYRVAKKRAVNRVKRATAKAIKDTFNGK
ncbi:HK97 gp10 family phage protein [Pseudaminobacter salicylatoxidans]|uniref:HK97 gp10 family phage protein n=1 Tax=Pseudaminobacter salicylatoxidans TaxID=93369 RepID=A0A316C5D9_PSESE|nr:HK97-gp10 family putative phage morphogenesis protein [Pseudaminobacter salicylatoxidans]PWJ84869.1 HK97 gp10 family phage protein [Pseudaminobacter salicylatoxidans]